VVEVVAGERFAIGRVEVEVVPARHWITPGTPRAQPVGYLLHAPGSPSVYFAGDTGWFPGLDLLAGRVDLALLPVWTWGPHLGPGHLGPRSAAAVLGRLGATGAVPIHWGTLYPRRLSRVWDRPLRQPGVRFAGHAAHLAPAADVRVLQPGASAAFAVSPLIAAAAATPLGGRLDR
jgi:L-ascorbate metabolism protein UlaG (beta-lactamase superfamily)